MFLSNTLTNDLGLMDAGVVALLGYGVVFFGLVLLMLVIMALGKSFTSGKKAPAAPAAAPAPAPVAPVTPAAPAVPTASAAPAAGMAPGSAGKIKLHNVPPKTAAMIMAIVANKMGKPLNELRFISIKEVE